MAELVPTGIAGLDELLGGGLVSGTMALVEGAPGSGKTTLGLQFVHHGVVARSEPGLVLTFEETPQQLYRDALNFGWDLRRLAQEGKLHVICITADVLQRYMSDAEEMWARLAHGIAPRRVLIDSVTHLRQLTSDEVRLRETLNVLLGGMRRQGLTALLLQEAEERGGDGIPFEEYAVDAVIRLSYIAPSSDGVRQRYLEILKTRGQEHVPGRHTFKFVSDGLRIFPRLRPKPIEPSRGDRRAFLGVAAFDHLLGRGAPAPAQIMVVGDTGVGKTLSSLLFLQEGLQCGDWCAYVGCDEVPAMTRRTLAHFGIATVAHERAGRLRFVDAYGREGTGEAIAVSDPANLDEFLNVEDGLLAMLQTQGPPGTAPTTDTPQTQGTAPTPESAGAQGTARSPETTQGQDTPEAPNGTRARTKARPQQAASAQRPAVRLCVDGMSTILATSSYHTAIDFVAAHLHNLRARHVISLDTYTNGALDGRLMANLTQHYDLVISLRFAEVHGTPIRLGTIEKYRFGTVARREHIFSVDPRVGLVFHQTALNG